MIQFGAELDGMSYCIIFIAINAIIEARINAITIFTFDNSCGPDDATVAHYQYYYYCCCQQ